MQIEINWLIDWLIDTLVEYNLGLNWFTVNVMVNRTIYIITYTINGLNSRLI